MRNLLRVVVAAICAIAAVPLASKPTPVRSAEVWEDIAELDRDVDRADARDTISEREAAGIRAQIADLKRQYRRQNANGLTPGEASALETRIGNLRARLGNDRRDRDHHRG